MVHLSLRVFHLDLIVKIQQLLVQRLVMVDQYLLTLKEDGQKMVLKDMKVMLDGQKILMV